MSLNKLYIFTGKGGVGKSTLSLSFAHHLKSQNINYKLVYFRSGKMGESNSFNTEIEDNFANQNLNIEGIDLIKSVKEYIARKLKSKTIASWIVKTPFFKSLVNMVPGFNYLIYMGQMIDDLEKDPSLIIILDSPSSGHALTMLESTKNFNGIFNSGVIYHDTKKILEKLTSPNFLKINIITLPSQLAINEAKDLREELEEIANFKASIYCNNSLSKLGISELKATLPAFLIAKLSNEAEALSLEEIKDSNILPHSMEPSAKMIIKELVPFMENLV